MSELKPITLYDTDGNEFLGYRCTDCSTEIPTKPYYGKYVLPSPWVRVEGDKCLCPSCYKAIKAEIVTVEASEPVLKIVGINEYCIQFDDYSCISYNHNQQCCENNYADFEYLKDECGIFDYEFKTPLQFQAVEGSGFRFGDAHRMFFVPCYSEQNGYYSDQIAILYSKDYNADYNNDVVLDFNAEERL